MNQVLLAANISTAFRNFLEEKHFEIVVPDANGNGPSSQHDIKGIITSNRLVLDADALQKFPNLKWIARLGSGMEIIDTVYCDAHQIKYFSSPAGIANSVAEHVMGMLLSLLHNIHSSQNEISAGKWIREPNRGIELESLTVGIIGFGYTGSCLAQKLSVFTKKILVYDKYLSGFSNEYIQESTLQEIKEHSDIISFHVPLNAETNQYYDEDFISKMKRNHIIINSSRGAIANTGAILGGLKSGKIIGACLDVLEEENNIIETFGNENNNVRKLLKNNVIITPHIAGYSLNAIEKMSKELLNQLKIILN